MDPRPDLSSDSLAWSRLLQAAFVADEELYGTLHGLRCLGFGLESYRNGVRLVANAVNASEYPEWRARYLEPYREQLTSLLRQAA